MRTPWLGNCHRPWVAACLFDPARLHGKYSGTAPRLRISAGHVTSQDQRSCVSAEVRRAGSVPRSRTMGWSVARRRRRVCASSPTSILLWVEGRSSACGEPLLERLHRGVPMLRDGHSQPDDAVSLRRVDRPGPWHCCLLRSQGGCGCCEATLCCSCRRPCEPANSLYSWVGAMSRPRLRARTAAAGLSLRTSQASEAVRAAHFRFIT